MHQTLTLGTRSAAIILIGGDAAAAAAVIARELQACSQHAMKSASVVLIRNIASRRTATATAGNIPRMFPALNTSPAFTTSPRCVGVYPVTLLKEEIPSGIGGGGWEDGGVGDGNTRALTSDQMIRYVAARFWMGPRLHRGCSPIHRASDTRAST